MITVPGDVEKGGDWDGKSHVDGVGEVDNLESAMDFAEHQRIVCDARGLLASFSQGAAAKWGTGKGDLECIVAFDHLKQCFESSTTKFKLTITKGIHQPLTNPHLQLTLHEAGKIDKGRKFHLDVAASLVKSKLGAEEPEAFIWQPVKFTYVDSQKHHCWPEAADPQLKKNTFGPGYGNTSRRRRNSISLATHNDRLAALEEKEAAQKAALAEKIAADKAALEKAAQEVAAAKAAEDEKARAAAAEQKRLAASRARGTNEAKILRAFTEKNKTFAKILKKERRALFDTGSAEVADKNGKKGGKLVWDGEKVELG